MATYEIDFGGDEGPSFRVVHEDPEIARKDMRDLLQVYSQHRSGAVIGEDENAAMRALEREIDGIDRLD